MAEDFLSHHVRTTFQSMQDKILEIYDMGYGWEVWAQVELSLEEKKALSQPDSRYTRPRFERERALYRRSRNRCDFVHEYLAEDGKKHRHFVEFKCLNKNNTPDAFAKLVEKDYDKITRAKIKNKWSKDVDYLAGWVVAVTVDPRQTGGMIERMRKLAEDRKFEWLSDFNMSGATPIVSTWTWTRTFIRDGKPV